VLLVNHQELCVSSKLSLAAASCISHSSAAAEAGPGMLQNSQIELKSQALMHANVSAVSDMLHTVHKPLHQLLIPAQEEARQEEARQEEARQGKARQGKKRQEATCLLWVPSC
jgi:glycine cleavage system pyridoxal-binding protein P